MGRPESIQSIGAPAALCAVGIASAPRRRVSASDAGSLCVRRPESIQSKGAPAAPRAVGNKENGPLERSKKENARGFEGECHSGRRGRPPGPPTELGEGAPRPRRRGLRGNMVPFPAALCAAGTPMGWTLVAPFLELPPSCAALAALANRARPAVRCRTALPQKRRDLGGADRPPPGRRVPSSAARGRIHRAAPVARNYQRLEALFESVPARGGK